MNSIINPLQRIETLAQLQTPKGTGSANEIPFKGIFEDAIKNVAETDAQVTKGVEELTSGQTDDPSQLMIDISKAQLSMSMLVQMRNKALDAYNEVMRINL